MVPKDIAETPLLKEIMELGSIGQQMASDRLHLMELVGIPLSTDMPLSVLLDPSAHGKLIAEIEDPANADKRQKVVDRLELLHAIRISVRPEQSIAAVMEDEHGLLLREIESIDAKMPAQASEMREYVLRTLDELRESNVHPDPDWPLRQLLDHAEIEQSTRLHSTAEVMEQHAVQDDERTAHLEISGFRSSTQGDSRVYAKYEGSSPGAGASQSNHNKNSGKSYEKGGSTLASDGFSISHTTAPYDWSRLRRRLPQILDEWQEKWSESIPRRRGTMPSTAEFLAALDMDRHVSVGDFEAMKAGEALPGPNLAAVLAAKVPKNVVGKFRTFMWLAGHEDHEHPKRKVEIGAADIPALLHDRGYANKIERKMFAQESGSWSNWVKNSREDREMTLAQLAELYNVEIKKLDPDAMTYNFTSMNRFENGRTCRTETELLAFMEVFHLQDRDDFRREHEQQVAKYQQSATLQAQLATATTPEAILDAAAEHDRHTLPRAIKNAGLSESSFRRMKNSGEFPLPVAEKLVPALGIAGEPFLKAVGKYWEEQMEGAQTAGQVLEQQLRCMGIKEFPLSDAEKIATKLGIAVEPLQTSLKEYWEKKIAGTETFGQMLEQMRKRAGMSMTDAAKALGTTKQRIDQIEKRLFTDRNQTPSLSVPGFAAAYGASDAERAIMCEHVRMEVDLTHEHGRNATLAGWPQKGRQR